MRMHTRFKIISLLGIAILVLNASGQQQGADWPQWRGPERTGVSRESGLLDSWPSSGPNLVWKAVGLGGAYGGPSISHGRIFGMGYVDDAEVVWSLDGSNGRGIWRVPIARATHQVGYPEGPRCTPTIDDDRLYALGVGGELVCMEAATGKFIWRRNLVRDFGGEIPGWGYSESPLVDGDRVIVTPGGRGATMVALNKNSGEVIWRSQSPGGDGAQYASAIAATVGGVRQYIQFLTGGVVGVAAQNGRFLWRYDRPANGTANCSTPIYHDGHVFAASGYNTGGGLVQIDIGAGGANAREVYFTRRMKNHHGGMVLVGEYLYGFDESTLTCLNFMTGQIMWADRSVGKGSLICADGHLYVRSEHGPVALVEANPNGYMEKGRFMQPERTGRNAWTHPVVAGGRLYIRDQDMLFCYNVSQNPIMARTW